MIEIKKLQSEAQLKAAYLIMKDDFGDDLSEAQFLEIVQAMLSEGCHLFGLMKENELLSLVCGGIRTDLSNGRHFQVYEMATAADHRSKGYGKQLMQQVERWAEDQGCIKVVLYSGLQRKGAQRFWEHHMRYERRGIVFKKEF